MVKLVADASSDAVAAAKAKIDLEPLLTFLDPFDKLGDFIKPFLHLVPDIQCDCIPFYFIVFIDLLSLVLIYCLFNSFLFHHLLIASRRPHMYVLKATLEYRAKIEKQ